MGTVIRIKRRPRPLRATYNSKAPYVVEREDWDDSTIAYHVVDMRPESYRTVCTTNDDHGCDPYAKFDAEQIARSMNIAVQYGLETLPKIKLPHDEEDFADLGDEE